MPMRAIYLLRKLLQNERGFTLAEFLVAAAIMGFVFILLTAFLKEGLQQYDDTVTRSDLQLELRLKEEQLKRDVLSGLSGNMAGTTYPVAIPEENRLILLHGTWNGIDWETYPVIYSFTDCTVFREEAGTNEPFLANVTSFQISVNEDHLVSITIEVMQTADYSRRSITRTLSIKAKPRGKL